MARLSDARIRSLKASSRDRWVGDGNGLWLRVRASGAKVFVIRTKRGGRARVLTLGPWPGVSLAEAREETHKIAGDRAGRLLRPQTGPQTVAALAQEFYERRIQSRYRRTKNALTYRKRLEQELGWRKLREVRPRDIAACVKAYAVEAPVAANRYLSFVKGVFGYAVETGALDFSPAAGITRAAAGGEERPRDRVLTNAELRALWHIEHEHGRLLRFLLLTGARIGEAQRATWSHIDLPARRWTIPAAHAKNKRAHWVHLPDAVLGILHLPGAAHEPILRSVSNTAVQAWLHRWCEREGIHPSFAPHDLRRSFVTRLGDLGIAPHVIRQTINHTEAGSLAVYLRAQYEAERVEATERWAAELARIVDGA